MRAEILCFVALTILGSCMNAPAVSSSDRAPDIAVVYEESLEDIELAEKKDRNALIIANVNGGKYKRADTYIALVGLVNRWRANSFEAVRVVSKAFAMLPDDQLTAVNVDRYLAAVGQISAGQKARAARVLIESGRLSKDEIAIVYCQVYDVNNPCNLSDF
jgi:hypothetical protein